MRGVNGLAVVVAFVLGAGAASVVTSKAQERDRSQDAAAIRASIESIFQAFIDKDRPKLEATHGVNWRGFQSYSRSIIRGRDGYMAASVGTGPMTPKGQGMVGYKIGEYDTVFYGDTAVVTFIAETRHMNGGRASTAKLTLLDVYAKEDGEWTQVGSNTSLHPDAQDQRMSAYVALTPQQLAPVLKAREAVWRAWYGGDTAALGQLLPPELITLGPGADGWGTHDDVIAASARYATSGRKLVRLEFPRTDTQTYGNTVILYTSYELDVQQPDGKIQTERGKATEVFVRRDGTWLNTAWQLGPEGRP
jgi:hypothetical protein